MWERIQKLLDRVESRIALWVALTQGIPVAGAGVVTGWLSTGVEQIDRYGWFGWWAAFLLGSLTAAGIMALASVARARWIQASAMRKWRDEVVDVNPLAPEFHRQRIRLQDIAHPTRRSIENKRFIDCELIGPAALVPIRGGFTGVNFNQCDIAVHRGNFGPLNVIFLINTEFIGGEVSNCIIFIPPDFIPTFHDMGAPFVTLTGVAEIDSQAPPRPGANHQR